MEFNVPTLPLKKRAFKSGRQAAKVRLKPKLVLLGLTREPPPQIQVAPEKLDSALLRVLELTRAAGAAIALGSGADLRCRASRGLAPPAGSRLDPEAGLAGLCFRTGEPLLCRDTEQDTRVDAAACRSLCVRSVLVIPLDQNGERRGILELFSPQPRTFTPEHMEAVNAWMQGLLETQAGPPVPLDGSAEDVPKSEGRTTAGLATEKHSPWSRTALAAALITAGVLGYGGSLRRLKTRPETSRKLTLAGQSGMQAAAAQPEGIRGATAAPTEARIQKNSFGASLQGLQQRAAAGDINAAYDLGEHYADGAVVERDDQQAMRWFTIAAQKGNASAQWKVGVGYLRGAGVRQDDAKAAEWFRRAANQAHIGAQMALSQLYFSGRGVPRDYVRAYTWGTIAAQTTNENNQALKEMQARMTPEQLADARHRVSLWWQHRAQPLPR